MLRFFANDPDILNVPRVIHIFHILTADNVYKNKAVL